MTDLHAALTGDRAGHAHTGAAYASAGAGYAPTGAGRSRRTAVVLTRLLFLLYGDDAGLWEPGLFHRFVLHHTTPATLGPQLARLFRLLGTAEGDRRHVPAAMAGFPPVTDGLFAEECPPGALPADVREALLAACRFRWTRISPAVFGSALQLVTSAKDRRAGGEHYTTEENILRVVDPLFLDELRAEARRLLRDPSTTVAELRRFRDRLAETVVVDPACGCGNFLAVAYREMRAVETEVIVAILGREREREREQERKQEGEGGGPGAGVRRGTTDPSAGGPVGHGRGGGAARASGAGERARAEQRVSLGQFHGIETNGWSATVAGTVMTLAGHLADRALAAAVAGHVDADPAAVPAPATATSPAAPATATTPAAPATARTATAPATAHIIHANALRLDWRAVVPRTPGMTYVFGNPPFLGDHTRTPDQLRDLRAAWGPGVQLSRLDYATGWHARTLRLLADRRGAFAFVTTSSVTQGDQPARLFRPIVREGWRIRFAHRTFPWTSEVPGRAAVRCVIIGFDREGHPPPVLWDHPGPDGRPVEVPVGTSINAYLVDGPMVLVEKRPRPLSPEVPPLAYGSKPVDGGHLVVGPEEYARVAADPVAARYLRPYVGSRELLHGGRRWCLWLVDADPADLERSPELRRRLAAVRAFRAASRAESTRAFRHDHLFRQRGFTAAGPVVGLPEVSSELRPYLPVAALAPGVVVSNKVYAAPDDGGVLFGLASSSMAVTWMRTVGGRLGSSLSLSNTVTWNNLPVPVLDAASRAAVVAAGRGVLAARALHPGRSLAEAYDPAAMDPALRAAHDALDRVVDAAFGASPGPVTERVRRDLLFARYLELTGEG